MKCIAGTGRFPAAVSLLLCLVVGSAGEAQTPGVNAKEIVIGSCAALDGPSSFLGRQTVTGAEAYFEAVNEEGGVNGRKLRLVSYDDSYDPEKAPACWAKLMEQKVFVMGFFVGTPTALKYVPLAEKDQVPLVGLFTGAQALYTPLRKWVINVRASYGDETKEMVDGLMKEMHFQKIGVIYPNDAFGSTVLAGVQAAMKERGAEPVAAASYQRQTNQIDGAIDEVKGANPDAVFVVGPSNTVSPIVKRAHAKGWKPLFLTVSFVGTDELISDAGTEAEGMIVTQVMPPYYLTDLKAVSAYRRALAKYKPNERPNFVSLEGFVDAMVLVEGLKKAGKEPTREGLIRGIESIHEMDLGLGPELKLDYSAKDHKGLDHVIPTVIQGGRAVPFTDWSSVAPK